MCGKTVFDKTSGRCQGGFGEVRGPLRQGAGCRAVSGPGVWGRGGWGERRKGRPAGSVQSGCGVAARASPGVDRREGAAPVPRSPRLAGWMRLRGGWPQVGLGSGKRETDWKVKFYVLAGRYSHLAGESKHKKCRLRRSPPTPPPHGFFPCFLLPLPVARTSVPP